MCGEIGTTTAGACTTTPGATTPSAPCVLRRGVHDDTRRDDTRCDDTLRNDTLRRPATLRNDTRRRPVVALRDTTPCVSRRGEVLRCDNLRNTARHGDAR